MIVFIREFATFAQHHEPQNYRTMRKIILIYGSITGAAIIASMIWGMVVADMDSNSFFASQTLGYLIMLIGFSTIFVATKKYRDEELGGIIKFGTALKVGLGITLIASVVYVISWEIHLNMTDYAFMEQYTASIIESERNSGATPEQLDQTIEQMNAMKKQYQNVWYRVPITFTEIFPIGLILSLLSAALFRKQNFLAAKK